MQCGTNKMTASGLTLACGFVVAGQERFVRLEIFPNIASITPATPSLGQINML